MASRGLYTTLTFFVAALVLGATITWVKRRQVNCEFPKCQARVIERNVHLVDSDGGRSWNAEVKCLYEYGGVTFEQSTLVADISFSSKNKAEAYLDERITKDGFCELGINNMDPRESYLLPFTFRTSRQASLFAW